MQQIKLNLGCGSNVLNGWVNVDNSPSVLLSRWPLLRKLLFRIGVINRISYEAKWSKDVVWKDLSRGLPYAGESVHKIYSSHLLEHMDRKGGEFLLRECFRVLKKGGIFRLVVPDLVFHTRRYLEKISQGDLAGREPHDEFLFNIYGAFLEKKRYGAWHRYMYDRPTLSLLLNSIGFSQVFHQDYRVSLDPELALLDNRPDDSLHIDAVK